MENEKGVWRTIRGRRVFIRDGESLASAMARSGKFKKSEAPNQNKIDKNTSERKKYEKAKEKYGYGSKQERKAYFSLNNEERSKLFNEQMDKRQKKLEDYKAKKQSNNKTIHTKSGDYSMNELQQRDNEIKQLYKDTWEGKKSYKELNNTLEDLKKNNKVSQGELDSLKYDASMETNKQSNNYANDDYKKQEEIVHNAKQERDRLETYLNNLGDDYGEDSPDFDETKWALRDAEDNYRHEKAKLDKMYEKKNKADDTIKSFKEKKQSNRLKKEDDVNLSEYNEYKEMRLKDPSNYTEDDYKKFNELDKKYLDKFSKEEVRAVRYRDKYAIIQNGGIQKEFDTAEEAKEYVKTKKHEQDTIKKFKEKKQSNIKVSYQKNWAKDGTTITQSVKIDNDTKNRINEAIQKEIASGYKNYKNYSGDINSAKRNLEKLNDDYTDTTLTTNRFIQNYLKNDKIKKDRNTRYIIKN